MLFDRRADNMVRTLDWEHIQAEESYKKLYGETLDEIKLLKSENIKLRKRIETLERMVDKLIKKLKGKN